jgi:phosphohistidine phosphatase
MLTVSLFRHAKSDWSQPGMNDHDRPLAPRGREAAPRMGAFMRDHALVPDRIICSTATRARQTLALILRQFQTAPTVVEDERLYLASTQTMLDMLRKTDGSPPHVMIIGHNPGLHGLALDLFHTGNDEAVAAICRKFPTAALAIVDFEADRWQDLMVGAGRLRLFMTPRSLPAQSHADA